MNGERVLIQTGGHSREKISISVWRHRKRWWIPSCFQNRSAAQAPTKADAIAGIWSGTVKGGESSFQITTTIAQVLHNRIGLRTI